MYLFLLYSPHKGLVTAPPSCQESLILSSKCFYFKNSTYTFVSCMAWPPQLLLAAIFLFYLCSCCAFVIKLKIVKINMQDLLTAPGRGTGISPLYVTHFTSDVSTVTAVLNLPREKTSLISVTLYAHIAEVWSVELL